MSAGEYHVACQICEAREATVATTEHGALCVVCARAPRASYEAALRRAEADLVALGRQVGEAIVRVRRALGK